MFAETRQIEVRADGNALVGTANRHGDRAEVAPGVFEVFAPDSLRWDDVILNRQHRRDQVLARTGAGLTVWADKGVVTFRADLPDTQDARDVRTLVARGILRGASRKFHALREWVNRAIDVKYTRRTTQTIMNTTTYDSHSDSVRNPPRHTCVAGLRCT